MFARYEMRMNIAAWDEKWLYVLVRYVTPAKKGKSKAKGQGKIAGASSSTNTKTDEKSCANGTNGHATNSTADTKTNGHANGFSTPLPGSGDGAPFPALHTPGSALPSEAATPLVSRSGSFVGVPGGGSLSGLSSITSVSSLSSSGHPGSNGTTLEHGGPKPLSGADLLALAPTEEPDGATLHCVSVSELCFKIGRITVPPAVVLGVEGFHRRPDPTSAPTASTSSPSDTNDTPQTPERYTHAHPPPSFVRALALQPHADLARGHLRTLQRFLREGWKDVGAGAGEGEGGRWWEDALGGEVEVKRKVNLERIRGVREGMFGAAAVVR
ncbi:hypothetical protein EIP86_007013 [Pleurotus ostreatoroseus]|nr:hypothetical protein EIP86_007013 [Pleurotus ostreatoroseus]